jgi:hypothetical protein
MSGTVPDMIPAAKEGGRFTKIPGPLGIESAMLTGKVAVVTGSGTFKITSTSWEKRKNT